MSRIEINFSTVVAEGEPAWVAEQVNRLSNVVNTRRVSLSEPTSSAVDSAQTESESTPELLREWLIDRNAKTQPEQFIATAVWLQKRGEQHLTSGAVRDALIHHRLVESGTTMVANATAVFQAVEEKGWAMRLPGDTARFEFAVSTAGARAVASRFSQEG